MTVRPNLMRAFAHISRAGSRFEDLFEAYAKLPATEDSVDEKNRLIELAVHELNETIFDLRKEQTAIALTGLKDLISAASQAPEDSPEQRLLKKFFITHKDAKLALDHLKDQLASLDQ